MNPLEKQFHIQQARLQTRKPVKDDAAALRGQKAVAPSFSAEVILSTDDYVNELERIHAWERKMRNRELVKLDSKRLSACRVKVARRIAANRIEDKRKVSRREAA